MSDEMKDVCYGCGKVDVYGSMRDVNDIEFDILCDACWKEKEKNMMDYKELYESATNEIATLKDEAKALDRKLTNLVLDLGWDCQRMSGSGVATYNDICRILNIEGYYEDFTEEESQGKVYDPPMSETEQYLLNKEREEEHKSYDY